MNQISKTLSLLALALVFTGCSRFGAITENLAKDNATVVGDVNSVYGRMKIIRANPLPTHNVTITPDGTVNITVKP